MNTLNIHWISAMRIMTVIVVIGNAVAWTRNSGGKAAFISSELTKNKFKYYNNYYFIGTDIMVRLNAIQLRDPSTFEEIMDIAGFDVDGNAMETLAAEGITNLSDFSCMKLSSFKKSELDPNGDRGLTLGEITLLETFWMWIHYQKATNPNPHDIDWNQNEETLKEWALMEATIIEKIRTGKPITKPIGGQFDSYKVDASLFRTFSGSNEDWVSWKRGFVGGAKQNRMHRALLGHNGDEYVPVGIQDTTDYEEQKTCAMNILVKCCRKGAARTIVASHNVDMNSYECFCDLVEHYESPDRTGKVIVSLTNKLRNLKLTNPNKGEEYIQKFEAYCQDLEDLGEPQTETTKRAMFVDGIKHHMYRSAIIPLSLQMNNSSLDLIEAVQTLAEKQSTNNGIRDHIATLNQQSGRPQHGGGRFNNSGRGARFNRGGGGGRGRGHASRSSNGRSGTWIPPEVFRSMSNQDQQAWIEFRAQQRRSSSNNVSSSGESSSSRANGNSNGGAQQQSRVNAALTNSINSVRTSSVRRYHLKGDKCSTYPMFNSLSNHQFIVNARDLVLVAMGIVVAGLVGERSEVFSHVAAVCACIFLISNNRGEDRVIVEKIYHGGFTPRHPRRRNNHVKAHRPNREAHTTSTIHQPRRTPANQDTDFVMRNQQQHRTPASVRRQPNGRVPTRQPRTNTVQSQVIIPPCRISNVDSIPHGNAQLFDGEAFNFEENEARINAIVDAGADHTMLSKSICVCLADTGRKIQVGGPMTSWKKRDLRLIEAATAYDHPSGQTFIIKVQAIESDEGTSLLSSSQLRAMGCEVDDVAKCHGGQSRIVSNCGVQVPLKYRQGLILLENLRQPTNDELHNCPIIDWNVAPWNPVEENDSSDDESVMPTLLLDDDLDPAQALNARSTVQEPDWNWLQKCFLNKPIKVIKNTIRATTQFATNIASFPLKRHFKSRFPALNVRRINEPVATDTFFSTVPAIGGATCAQIFVGLVSKYTRVYPMHTESEFKSSLQKFVTDVGAPTAFMSDNAQAETSKDVKTFLRVYKIQQKTSEPHYEWQNPAERRIQEVKAAANALMDEANAPEELWYLACYHATQVLNILAKEGESKTPYEKCLGETPDRSAFVHFHFMQPVLYRTNSSYPDSKERLAHWITPAEHCGDALTYIIRDAETGELLVRSVMRAIDKNHPNFRSIKDSMLQKQPKDQGEDIAPSIESSGTPVIIDHADLSGVSYTNLEGEQCDVQSYDEANSKFTVSIKSPSSKEIRVEEMSAEDINAAIETVKLQVNDDVYSFNSINNHRKNSKGKWEVELEWSDGTSTWEPLSNVIVDDPITCARYAKEHDLLEVQGWKRLRTYAERDGKYLRSNVNALQADEIYIHRGKVKFGVRVPRNTKEAYRLDEENGNKLWAKAIDKEINKMKEYQVFQVLPRGAAPPEGYSRIPLHFVYDVKHDGRHRATMVAGGHVAPEPEDSISSTVCSLSAVRTVLLLAELNELKLTSIDIGNAYLEAKTTEKVYTIAGPEFADDQGKIMIILQALYGLQSSGARWHEVLVDALRSMGWRNSECEPDVWYRDAGSHYEFVCVFVDDLLIASKRNEDIHDDIKRLFTVKGGEFPSYYLGADLEYVEDPNDGRKVLTMSCKTYLKNVIPRIEKKLQEVTGDVKLGRSRVLSPMHDSYQPENETEMQLDNDDKTLFGSLVGMSSWTVQLCRIDVAFATNLLASFRNEPSKSHLKAMGRVFAYLKSHSAGSIKFNPDKPDFSQCEFIEGDWGKEYGDLKEEIPKFAIAVRGKPVVLSCFVDASFARDPYLRRSTGGTIHFINSAPIKWKFGKQGTVETSVYGAEFTALRRAVEETIALRLFLRSIGVPIEGPTIIFGDNLAVLKSAAIPEVILKKKHLSISYHFTRQAVASGIIKLVHVSSAFNVADVLTKPLPGYVMDKLLRPVLYFDKYAKSIFEFVFKGDKKLV